VNTTLMARQTGRFTTGWPGPLMHALKEVNWRAFGILLPAGLLGVVAVLPLILDLVSTVAPRQDGPPLSLPLLITLALAQNGLLLAVAITLGLMLAPRVGLTMPVIEAWAGGRSAPPFGGSAVRAFALGAGAGAALVAIDVLFFLDSLSAPMRASFDTPLWKRLLAGVVYGGITEELLMRLFLLSLVVWLLGRWWRTSGRPADGAFWMGIAIVALIFGLGHLPATSLLAPLTPALVVRALWLNGIAGVAFGYLYWRHGLEAAMLGHMSAHLVIQIPGVLLISRIS
jgi:membrane protease YdiL (CAAX protease family)